MWKIGTKSSHLSTPHTCEKLVPNYLIKLCHEWKIGIECKIQQLWGYFINVRNTYVYYMQFYFVHIFHKVWECDVLVPIFSRAVTNWYRFFTVLNSRSVKFAVQQPPFQKSWTPPPHTHTPAPWTLKIFYTHVHTPCFKLQGQCQCGRSNANCHMYRSCVHSISHEPYYLAVISTLMKQCVMRWFQTPRLEVKVITGGQRSNVQHLCLLYNGRSQCYTLSALFVQDPLGSTGPIAPRPHCLVSTFFESNYMYTG